MADFPTLSQPIPVSLDQGLTGKADIKHDDDAGYQITRRRFTRDPRTLSASYELLTDADAVLLQDFIDIHTTVVPFNWTQPSTGTTYEVRFSAIPSLRIRQLNWSISCDMVEV